MSEKAPKQNEKLNNQLEGLRGKEARQAIERMAKNMESKAKSAERKHSPEKEASEARKSIEKHAKAKHEHEDSERQKRREKSSEAVEHVNRGYKATMRRVEAGLPGYQRRFSKIVHNPIVDQVSQVAGRTVARPSAITGAGASASLGMIVLLFFAAQNGFELNPTLFLLMLATGWGAGLVFEGVWRLGKRTANR